MPLMDWLQAMNYLSGPVIAVIAGVGLWQLTIAKRTLEAANKQLEVTSKDLEHRIQSERVRLAIDLCARYEEHVLPLIDEALLIAKRRPFPQPGADRSPWDPASYSERWNVGRQPEKAAASVLRALNAMEAIALPFVSDAADRDLARASIGRSFVDTANQLAFVAASSRSRNPDAFPAVRQLVGIWLREGESE